MADASSVRAGCPSSGRTLARDSSPTVRVYRAGTQLKACLKAPGQRRIVRVLDRWTSATRVVTRGGAVAWSARLRGSSGPVGDVVSAVDITTGKRWLRTRMAVPAGSATEEARADTVLGLVVDADVVAWTTSSGVTAAALRRAVAPTETYLRHGPPGPPTVPYRVGRRYLLGDAGPEHAARVARALRLERVDEDDEEGCRGSASLWVRFLGADRLNAFRYGDASWTGACR